MAKLIILVTHGEAEPDPNGFLTQKGRKQMEELRDKLDLDEIGYVISGEAPRQREACSIITGGSDMISETVGVADVFFPDEEHMVLADGKGIPVDEYLKTRFKTIKQRIKPFLREIFNQPEEKILIVGGRITAIGAGIPAKKAKSACIYHIWLTPSGKVKIKEQ